MTVPFVLLTSTILYLRMEWLQISWKICKGKETNINVSFLRRPMYIFVIIYNHAIHESLLEGEIIILSNFA